MSVVEVYAPTEVCETEEKMFYAKFDSVHVLDQCPRCNVNVNVNSLSWATLMLSLALKGLAMNIFWSAWFWHQK